MVRTRAFDVGAANLQRQGHLALWVSSYGQEAAQVGSARAAREQDTIFPSYREHAVGMIRGLDPLAIVRLLRGVAHGTWDPAENGNFRQYCLVLGSQTLHGDCSLRVTGVWGHDGECPQDSAPRRGIKAGCVVVLCNFLRRGVSLKLGVVWKLWNLLGNAE